MKPSQKSTTVKKRILLVDDHPLVRDWLAQMINREADLAVCGQAGNAAQASAAIQTWKPAMVVLDLSMEGTQGTELIKDLVTQYPDLSILVLSAHDEMQYAERALRAGARGYVTKQENADVIMLAIRRVAQGETYTSERIASLLLRKLTSGQTPAASPLADLSDRQLEIFQLIGRGQGPTQIAEKMRLSVKTVENYIARIKEKLALDDADQLRAYAIECYKDGG